MGCEHPSPRGRWWICKVPIHLPFISRDARATCCTVKACGVTPCSFLIWHLLKECFQDCSAFCFDTNLLRIYADWTHSQHVICCQKQRFELSAEGHVSKKLSRDLVTLLLYPTHRNKVWVCFVSCFLTCNWRTLISFHSDLVCADYGEGASSKGQARGHSEACYEFWSISWPLALPPFSMCCPALQPHPYHACGLTSPHLPLLFCPLQLDEAED